MTDNLARKRTAAVEMAREYRCLNGDPIDNIEALLTEISYPDDPQPEFDLPVGQMVVRVEDADGVNIIFSPPIPCVMRDPDGQDRPVRLTDTDDLVARIFAGWQMVEVA